MKTQRIKQELQHMMGVDLYELWSELANQQRTRLAVEEVQKQKVEQKKKGARPKDNKWVTVRDPSTSVVEFDCLEKS